MKTSHSPSVNVPKTPFCLEQRLRIVCTCGTFSFCLSLLSLLLCGQDYKRRNRDLAALRDHTFLQQSVVPRSRECDTYGRFKNIISINSSEKRVKIRYDVHIINSIISIEKRVRMSARAYMLHVCVCYGNLFPR